LSRLTSGFFAVARPANAFPIVFMPSAAKLRQSVCNTLTSLQ